MAGEAACPKHAIANLSRWERKALGRVITHEKWSTIISLLIFY